MCWSQQIITIENLTTFYRVVEQSALVIYLGGFHNEARRNLIGKAHQAFPKAKLFHWGDIDLGGFRIFRSMKDVVPNLEPHLMGLETLMKYREQCQPLSKGYGKLLKGLLKDEGYGVFHDVIRFLFQENIRLEQEGVFIKGESS